MARHIEAWMNGIRLSGIGAVVIKNVNEPGPETEITYAERPMRGGQGVVKRRRKSLKITILAQIHELFDLPRRTEIRQAIAAWSEGGILELSNHPGQQLHVISSGEPGLGDVRDFNSEIEIALEANEIPYWEEKIPVRATGEAGTTGSVNLLIPGSCREIPVNAVVTPAEGSTMTALAVTVSCGNVTRNITLSGFSTTDPVVFGLDEHDLLTITAGTASLMPYRTQESADDLMIPAGQAVCYWAADCSVTPVFGARGRWL